MKNLEENKERILENIKNGKAYNKFFRVDTKSNGDISYIKNPEKFQKAKYIMPLYAEKTGYIEKLDARQVGVTSVHLGAGRIKKEDSIDHAVGIWLEKKIGDKVKQGDILAYVHANNEDTGKTTIEELKQAYRIADNPVKMESYILDII